MIGLRVGEQGRQAEAGVVDQNVQTAESCECLGNESAGRGRIGEVGRDCQDLEARLNRLQLTRKLLEPIRPPSGQDDRACLFLPCQLASEGRSDSGGSAGEQDDAAGSRHRVVAG